MNDAMSDGGGGGGRSISIDDLIELATERHLEECPGKYAKQTLSDHPSALGKVYDDPNEPWQWMVDNDVAGSVDSAKSMDTVKVNGDDTITVEFTGEPGVIHFVQRGGKVWNDTYAMFEEVKPVFEKVDTYPIAEFGTEVDTLNSATKQLKPVDNIEDHAKKLLSIDVGSPTSDKDKEALESLFGNATSQWGSIEKVAESLAAWEGRAAEIFRGTYGDRFQSVLTGQMLVAKVLADTLQIVKDSYYSFYTESNATLRETYNLLEAFPDVHEGQAPATDWKTVLTAVSGTATVVGGAAAPLPGVGTGIAAVSGVVAGSASLGSMIVETPTQKELEGSPAYVSGGTVIKIMDKFHKRIKRFRTAVQNSEDELTKWLNEFEDVIKDTNAHGITIFTTWGEDVPVSQWHSFFAIKPPKLGKIDKETSHGSIESKDYMGTAPDKGEQLSGDLERLLKAGHEYLPDMAGTYGSLSIKGLDEGIDFGFTREGSKSPVYGPWAAIFAVFESMITSSEEHLNDAASALIAAAESYAADDDAAAADLREKSEFYD